jgi:uncharacterized protein
MAVMTQQWADIVWAHWRVDAGAVSALLPSGVHADCYDGSAWVGFVPFEMRDLRLAPGGIRLPGIGSTASFSEVNVRTYVTGPDGPGVWFHSLDASSGLAVAVARGVWSLPYHAAAVRSRITDDERAWTVRRRDGTTGGLRAALGSPVGTDTLAAFLTARFRLYASLGRRHLLTAPIRHDPWQLRHATIEELDLGLVGAAGYDVTGPADHVRAASPVAVTIGMPRLIPI